MLEKTITFDRFVRGMLITFLVGAICTSCHPQKQLSITHFCQFLGAIYTAHRKSNKILIEIEEYLKPYFVAIVY